MSEGPKKKSSPPEGPRVGFVRGSQQQPVSQDNELAGSGSSVPKPAIEVRRKSIQEDLHRKGPEYQQKLQEALRKLDAHITKRVGKIEDSLDEPAASLRQEKKVHFVKPLATEEDPLAQTIRMPRPKTPFPREYLSDEEDGGSPVTKPRTPKVRFTEPTQKEDVEAIETLRRRLKTPFPNEDLSDEEDNSPGGAEESSPSSAESPTAAQSTQLFTKRPPLPDTKKAHFKREQFVGTSTTHPQPLAPRQPLGPTPLYPRPSVKEKGPDLIVEELTWEDLIKANKTRQPGPDIDDVAQPLPTKPQVGRSSEAPSRQPQPPERPPTRKGGRGGVG